MRCTKAKIWLQGYVDGNLSSSRMKRIRRHLDRCAACASELTAVSALKTFLTENRAEAPAMGGTSDFFWSQVAARIKGESQPRRVLKQRLILNWQWVLGWATASAGIGLVAAFIWIQTWPQPSLVTEYVPPGAREAKIARIITSNPDLYAEAYHSKQSRATIIWTEGMPVISLEL